MGDLSNILDTPEKFLIVAGTVCVVVAIIAPTRVAHIGFLQWTRGKRVSLGVLGCLLLTAGVFLKRLPNELFFTTVPQLTAPPAQAGLACNVLKSTGDQPASIEFVNTTQGTVRLYWINDHCILEYYYDLETRNRLKQQTYAGHRWLVTDLNERPMGIYVATKEGLTATIRN